METNTKTPNDKVDREALRADVRKWLEKDVRAIIALMSTMLQSPGILDTVTDQIMEFSDGPAINAVQKMQERKEAENGV